MKTIHTGQILKARSIGDHDCIFTAEILERKGSFATVKAQGITRRMKVYRDDRGEFVYALGQYSMCPIFRAA